MANERVMPEALGRVHVERRTPWVAILFTTALAMVLIAVGKLDTLATVTVMLLLVVFALVYVAVLALRRERVEHPHFQTPRAFPVLGLVISAALFAKQIADGDSTVFAIFGSLLAVGVLPWAGARCFSGWARPADTS